MRNPAGQTPAGEVELALPHPSAGGPLRHATGGLARSGDFVDRSRAQHCLTLAVYYEAASEPAAGQRAVAQVVLNRVAHPSYPDTVCGVVFEGSDRASGCQFSFTCDGALARKPARIWWDRAARVARAALAGAVYAPIGLATHYHTLQVHPYWADSLDPVGTVGAHRFYRWRGPAGRASAFNDRYRGGEPAAVTHPRIARPVAVSGAALPEPAQAPTPPVLPDRTLAADSPVPAFAADLAARGGDALFRVNLAPQTGEVRAQYAGSGQWLRQP